MAVEAGTAYVKVAYDKTSASRTSGQLKSFVGGLAAFFAAKKIFDFGKQAIDEAAQTQKAQESIRANFGKSGEAVIKFNENAAASFGITNTAASQFATQIGLMTTNIGLSAKQGAAMTIGLEKLAGAVALIKGQDPAASFGKLNKALLGNTRGLKDMGIAITPLEEKNRALIDGFIGPKGTVSALTAAQKAQVIYQIAMKHLPTLLDQAKQHSGDLADQELVLSAQFSNLKEEIGAKLLPVVTSFFTWISTHKQLVTDLAIAVGALAVAFGTASVASTIWNSSLVGLGKSLVGTTAKTTEATVATEELATVGINPLAVGIAGLIGLGVGAWLLDTLGGLTPLQKASQQTGDDIQALKGDFHDLHGALKTSVADLHALRDAEKAGDPKAVTKAWNAYEKQQFKVGAVTEDIAKKFRNLRNQTDQLEVHTRKLIGASTALAGSNGRNAGILQQFSDQLVINAGKELKLAQVLRDHGNPQAAQAATNAARHAQAVADLTTQLNRMPTKKEVDIYVRTHIQVTNEVVTVRAGPEKGKPLTTGASGAVVTRPTWALIGEAGPEAIMPLSKTPGSHPISDLGGVKPVIVEIASNDKLLNELLSSVIDVRVKDASRRSVKAAQAGQRWSHA